MRNAKSLISGFGVGISLVGAVACAFFITAALVAFHGSLSVSAGYAPRSAVLTASAKHDPPIVIGAAPGRAVAHSVASSVASSAQPPVTAEVIVSQTKQHAPAPDRAPIVTSASSPAKTPTPASSPPSTTAPLANATAGLTNVVGGVVANATSSLGKTVAPISPALNGTLVGLGSDLAKGVVAIGNTVAAIVNALGAPASSPQG